MKLTILREELIREAVKAVSAIVAAAVLAGSAMYYRQSAEETLAKLKRDIALSNNRIVKLEEENTETLRLFSRINQVPAAKKEVPFNDLASRVGWLQPKLEDIKRRYRLTQLDISMTNAAPLGGGYDQGSYQTMFNTVTLTFGGLSDEIIFSFLQELAEITPGYLRFEVLEMRRLLPIDQNVFLQIRGGRQPVLVAGRAIISWRTIRKK